MATVDMLILLVIVLSVASGLQILLMFMRYRDTVAEIERDAFYMATMHERIWTDERDEHQ